MAVRLAALMILIGPAVWAQTSPHGNLTLECQTCHTTESWEMSPNASFDHDRLGFPLSGQHESVDCAACHDGLRFEPMDNDCASCHLDIHRNELGTECARCHTTQTWLVPDMIQRHQETQFPLLGRHSTADCASCHPGSADRRFSQTPIDCAGCHLADFEATTSPDHLTAGFSTDCVQCHSPTATSWSQGFDHNATAFPLTGQHVTASCASCHTDGTFAGTPTDCSTCHITDYEATTAPNHQAAQFDTDCAMCHTTSGWEGAPFDHDRTAFSLTGLHVNLDCQSCHSDNLFAGKPTDCLACHETDFTATQNPSHSGQGFSTDCETCHATTGWSPASFDHEATGFQLTGSHVSADCQSCHVNGNYQLTYTDCFQCHETEFRTVVEPNHVLGDFSHDCQPCHSTSAWLPASFDHNGTGFPLTGAHVTADCQSCHIKGNYQLTYTDCYECHDTEFQAVVEPDHVEGNFSHNCEECHSTNAWLPATFDHASTSFPLTGAHVTTDCQSCHINGNYQLTYTDCFQCHETEFQTVEEPDHVAGNFSHNCEECHSTTAWLPSTFDHAATTFPLTGEHLTTDCESCHINGNYQLTYTDCYQCHEEEYQSVSDPDHVSGNFSHDCSTCHSTTDWTPATLDHNLTGFPLTGAHVTTQCEACHVNGNYQLTYTDCYQCHETEFQAVIEPNHVTGNFSHNCEECHTTNAWLPATFDHNETLFPLTGAHTTTNCESCHINGNYQLSFDDCYQCHETEFQAVIDPDHVAGNFSHNCENCHSTIAWLPATFDHNETLFPLTGAHTTTNCESCHINGNYQLTYEDCYQCHETEFQAVPEPNHVAGNFSHNCEECHTTNAWLPSTFDHNETLFPLTGAHQAITCSDCHIDNVYQGLSTLCFDCHEAAFNNSTNPDHLAGGFPTECEQCHTTSGWTPATFDHNLTSFPLTGAHVTTDCQSCHINGNYQLTYEDCYQCHQDDYERPNDPNHVALQFSHDCTPCHTTIAWLPSTFDHDNQYFRIYSGAHQGEWSNCSDCHPNPGNFSEFTCTTCHERERMDDKHDEVPGYIYESQACFDCHRGEALFR